MYSDTLVKIFVACWFLSTAVSAAPQLVDGSRLEERGRFHDFLCGKPTKAVHDTHSETDGGDIHRRILPVEPVYGLGDIVECLGKPECLGALGQERVPDIQPYPRPTRTRGRRHDAPVPTGTTVAAVEPAPTMRLFTREGATTTATATATATATTEPHVLVTMAV